MPKTYNLCIIQTLGRTSSKFLEENIDKVEFDNASWIVIKRNKNSINQEKYDSLSGIFKINNSERTEK